MFIYRQSGCLDFQGGELHPADADEAHEEGHPEEEHGEGLSQNLGLLEVILHLGL